MKVRISVPVCANALLAKLERMSAALAMPAVRRENIDKYVLESGSGDVHHSSCCVVDLSAKVIRTGRTL